MPETMSRRCGHGRRRPKNRSEAAVDGVEVAERGPQPDRSAQKALPNPRVPARIGTSLAYN